jgi:biotin operon repressor
MTQIEKVANYLSRNTTSPGVTASKIASDTKVPRENVIKRISDLRNEGYTIFSNKRTLKNGRKALYYRLYEAA